MVVGKETGNGSEAKAEDGGPSVWHAAIRDSQWFSPTAGTGAT